MFNHRCYVCSRVIQPRVTRWKNAFVLSRNNHMLSNVPQEAKCGLCMHQHSLGACPLVHWSTLTGANTLSHNWSLGQSKCQLCAMKPMSQCWQRTQGRRPASRQPLLPYRWHHLVDFSSSSSFVQVPSPLSESDKPELRATHCQSSLRFPIGIHRLDRERAL